MAFGHSDLKPVRYDRFSFVASHTAGTDRRYGRESSFSRDFKLPFYLPELPVVRLAIIAAISPEDRGPIHGQNDSSLVGWRGVFFFKIRSIYRPSQSSISTITKQSAIGSGIRRSVQKRVCGSVIVRGARKRTVRAGGKTWIGANFAINLPSFSSLIIRSDFGRPRPAVSYTRGVRRRGRNEYSN